MRRIKNEGVRSLIWIVSPLKMFLPMCRGSLVFLTGLGYDVSDKGCEHRWRYYNLHDHTDYKCYLDRRCKNCGLEQHRSYLGGGMWRWVDVSEK